MSAIDFLAVALSAFYLSYAISSSAGPFGWFAQLRERLPLGGIMSCLVCLSPWLSALFYALLILAPSIVYIFAAAGVSVFLFRYTGGSQIV